MFRTTIITFVLILTSLAVFGQSGRGNCSEPIRYINRNFYDSKPLKLRTIKGLAVDSNGISVPNICVALFSEDGRRLVMQVAADDEGNFGFKDIPDGKYRLVGRVGYDAFCPVNVRIHLQASGRTKRIKLHMRPSAIDDCSYGDTK